MKSDQLYYDRIVMVGPEIDGLGGISRVVKIWKKANFFSDFSIDYIASTSDSGTNSIKVMLLSLANFVWKVAGQKALVYVHTSSNHSFYRKAVFLSLASFFKCKSIVHIHPTHFYDFLRDLHGLKRKLVFGLLQRTTAFVVLTNTMGKRISSLLPRKPVMVLENPVDITQMANTNNISREDRCLLYLGWYIATKGVYELVDAVQILHDKGIEVSLNFFGTKQIDALRNYVAGKKLTSRIQVNGWIDDTSKIDQLWRSTALVLPSHSEGIPNVILEAMATQTPVVATDVGGLAEILRHEVNSLICPVNNPLALAHTLEKLLENPTLRINIANRAYQDAIKYYDVSNVKKRFQAIISSVRKNR